MAGAGSNLAPAFSCLWLSVGCSARRYRLRVFWSTSLLRARAAFLPHGTSLARRIGLVARSSNQRSRSAGSYRVVLDILRYRGPVPSVAYCVSVAGEQGMQKWSRMYSAASGRVRYFADMTVLVRLGDGPLFEVNMPETS
jgi:hypothetical protein